MKPHFVIFLLYLSFLSCHDGDTNVLDGPNTVITQFPEEETVAGGKMDLEIMGINDLYVVDTFFIAFKPSGHNGFFEIYSTNTFKYLGQFLAQGRGPNEFLNVSYDGNYFHSGKDLVLWISDLTLNKRCSFNLTQSLKTGETVCDTIFRIQYAWGYSNINDSIAASIKPQQSNLIFNLQNIHSKEILTEHKLYKTYIHCDENSYALGMELYKHPQQNLFVGNMSFFNQINFFSADMKDAFSISYGQPVNIFDNLQLTEEELTTYYFNLSSTEKYIYALYINQPWRQFPYFEKGVEIHVFDWSGKPVKKINIPESIVFFTVDEPNGYLYGLKVPEEIYRYPLKKQTT